MLAEPLKDLGLDHIAILGLAKRYEEIFFPDKSKPIILQRGSAGLKLLQYVRDEAHRFAISFHRHLRNKLITNSLLDDIPNVGEKRKMELLRVFGSVQNLRRSSPEGIASKSSGISLVLANQIYDYLKKNG